ncbi:Vegetative incompatibility protein HET-E-1 [Ceratobasidium theobromae]|uniref:Vegetative incompatibility protein HET-E-1 n=1 Tax=Ceratobasidium theobromae TaxID=1582974 RepID=A0A5N5QFA6_9AGAM|nr:Vegetative incompatibility protein HET-E-1 [Ceratobasidium theobromae]
MDGQHVLMIGHNARHRTTEIPPSTSASEDELPTGRSKAETRRSQSPSAEASTSGAYPTSPPPQSTPSSLAPPTVKEAAALRHVQSPPMPSPSEPATKSDAHIGGLNGLQSALNALHACASIFPPLQSAVGALISCLDVFEGASKNRKEYEAIATELKTLSLSLAQHIKQSNSTRMSDCVTNVAFSIEQQAKTIIAKQKRGTGRALLEESKDEEEIIGQYRRIEALFRQLQTDANLSTWSIANEHLVNTRLEGLAPAKLASYDSILSTEINRRTCTDGTRTAVLSTLGEWSHDASAPDLYWMDGMAGTGKTTIACSFSKILEGRKQLAASFFCTRSSPECRQVGRIIPTIAYQLARYSIPFQGALCEILGNEPDIGTKNVVKQVERLLKEPLDKVKNAIPDNLVVAIDALDECEDRHGVRLVLDLLFKVAPSIPLKFFVTSRPEPGIYSKMVSQNPRSRTVLHLHEIEKSLVKADIELYLNEELNFMSPTNQQIEQLVERSGNLFIYAATLVRYIQPTIYSIDPQRRLELVLAMTPQSMDQYAEVDLLYTVVLQSALGEKHLNAGEVEDMRLVLQTVLCVQEPVNIDTLAILAGISSPRQALSALQPLRSVIHFSEDSGTVSALHASFPDYMFNQARSGLFFCDRAEHNQLLAQRCFEVMKSQLRFNICNLESSYVPDSEVADLKIRIEKAISPTLWYTSLYWGDHLRLAASSSALCVMVEDFLSVRLLFWMEVLNLKKSIGLGAQILMKAKLWLQDGSASSDVTHYCNDAHGFVTSYAANPVSQSTPHIYISSLPLLPRSSSVFKHYWGRTRNMINLKGSGIEHREMAALATWVLGSAVRSITYSLDGSRVAYGCKDGSIGIRNIYDGSIIVDPFKAHTDAITSVAFSSDGSRLVSSSVDGTIHVWHAEDGTLAPGPFNGHDGTIASVAFSPDGLHVVSGSTDRTVRVWRAIDGAAVGHPFHGHTRAVWTVAVSPNGMHIASGSTDCTLRVWNLADGALVSGPLRGHTSTIWSVGFSPDGALIASGSEDKTIRLWDAGNGTPVASPLEGHTSGINSIAFSRDSQRLVSGGDDLIIIVWSVANRTLIAGPFKGHSDIIRSVGFLPDATRVISGASDRTIRVWNTHSNILVPPPSEGHTGGVWSVAFSPDGSRVTSGSTDTEICLWNAHDGKLIAAPFKGHTGKIWSVAFSPNGEHIASGSSDCKIRMWNAQNGTPGAKPFFDHSEVVNSIAFSPDGTRLVSGSNDGGVRVQSFPDGELVAGPLRGHTGAIMSVAFSPDGTRITSGSRDNTTRVWDSSKGTLITNPFHGHTDWVMSVAFSPDGLCVASGSRDHTIRVWRAADGDLVAGPFKGHTDVVRSIAYSPDGKWVASASYDRNVRLWNLQNVQLIFNPLYGHTWWVTSIAFSPDGTQLVSGSNDHSIRMWDIRDYQQTTPSSSSPNHSSSLPAANRLQSTVHSDWGVRDDGWIISADSGLLFWAPPEIRRSLLTPRCTFIISRDGMTEIDMAQALLGERWHECYVSE